MIRVVLLLVALACAGGVLIAMLNDGTLRQTLLVFEAMDIMLLFFVVFIALAERVAPGPRIPGKPASPAHDPGREPGGSDRRA